MELIIKRTKGRPKGSGQRHPISTSPVNGKRPVAWNKWQGMKQRCLNSNSIQFKDYGGRGIAVCERWLGHNGFTNFYNDMGDPNGLTLGRIDNDKGYSPDNCRWETWAQQAVNRRPHQPTKGSLRNRSKLAGLPYMLVYHRVRLGWSEDKALTNPKLPRGRQSGTTFKYKPRSI
jgi:hypothetical protein